MKKCNNCGANVQEENLFCTKCGGNSFSSAVIDNKQFSQQLNQQVQSQSANSAPLYQARNVEAVDNNDNGVGNVFAGIVGALLFSIIGGILYFVVWQIGFIAGICGSVTFILANFGYRLFAGTKNKSSIVAMVIAIVSTLIMIFVAEFFCISFELYWAYDGADITIFDAIRATPEVLGVDEVGNAFAEHLIMAYVFSFIATIGDIINIVKSRKRSSAVMEYNPVPVKIEQPIAANTEVEAVICPGCGAMISKGTKFCTACGKKVPEYL